MKLKTIIIPVLIIALTIALSTAAFAADADDVIADFSRMLENPDINPQLERLIGDALDWLMVPANAETVSDENAAIIITEMRAVEATIGSARNFASLGESKINAVINGITKAANAMGMKFEVVVSGTSMEFYLKDAGGNTLTSASAGNPVKQTGPAPDPFDTAAFFAASALFFISVAMTFLFRKSLRRTVEYPYGQKYDDR